MEANAAKRTSKVDIVADILFLVMQAPRTRMEVAELVSAGEASVFRWMEGLHEHGVFFIIDWKPPKWRGPFEPVYAMQQQPFASPDVERP